MNAAKAAASAGHGQRHKGAQQAEKKRQAAAKEIDDPVHRAPLAVRGSILGQPGHRRILPSADGGPGLGSPRAYVAFQHGRRDIGAGRPLSAALPGVGLVIFQAAGIGLNNIAALQEQEPGFRGRHPHREVLGLGEYFPQPHHGGGGVDRRVAGDTAEVFDGVSGRASNFVDDSFRRETRSLTD